MKTETEATRTGVLTSEFLLTVLGVIALVALVLTDNLDGQWAAVAIGAACFGYQASRAVVKKALVDGQASVANFRADLVSLAETEDAPTPRRRATRAASE